MSLIRRIYILNCFQNQIGMLITMKNAKYKSPQCSFKVSNGKYLRVYVNTTAIVITSELCGNDEHGEKTSQLRKAYLRVTNYGRILFAEHLSFRSLLQQKWKSFRQFSSLSSSINQVQLQHTVDKSVRVKCDTKITACITAINISTLEIISLLHKSRTTQNYILWKHAV